jgi:hypothetical protein
MTGCFGSVGNGITGSFPCFSDMVGIILALTDKDKTSHTEEDVTIRIT